MRINKMIPEDKVEQFRTLNNKCVTYAIPLDRPSNFIEEFTSTFNNKILQLRFYLDEKNGVLHIRHAKLAQQVFDYPVLREEEGDPTVLFDCKSVTVDTTFLNKVR